MTRALLPLALFGLYLALVNGVIPGDVSLGATTPSLPRQGSPIYGVTLPDGYRDWELVAPSQETGGPR